MQLFALNNDNESILAQEALRHKNYLCPECRFPVRARGGPHKRDHFYHLKGNNACSQHKKSLPHIYLQLYLLEQIPEVTLERPFPQIGRIADVYWEEKKIVFEVQCSPMSLEEATERCNDYGKLGIQVIWILHQKQFNKRRIAPAEQFLRAHTSCYFASMDEEGKGIIYDQFEVSKQFGRLFRGPPLRVDLRSPKKLQEPQKELPEALKKRIFRWPYYFPGDLYSHFINGRDFSSLFAIEKRFTHLVTPSFGDRIKKGLQILFHYLLEKASQ